MGLRCSRCNSELPDQAKFCPQCGRSLGKRSTAALITGVLLLLIAGGGSLWAVTWSTKQRVPEKRPMMAAANNPHGSNPHQTNMGGHGADVASSPAASDPALKGLFQDVKDNPNDISKRKALADAMLNRLNEQGSGDPHGIMDVLNAYRDVLKLDPNDPDSLLKLAGITFSSGVSDKAMDYYARYLKIKPEDLQARSQYAAAMLMLDQVDAGIEQLNQVLAKDPNNFHALVNLAAAQLKKGDKEGYAKAKDKAVAAAPENEKEQIKEFLSSLENSEWTKKPAATTPEAPSPVKPS